jgi:hypothetical protein
MCAAGAIPALRGAAGEADAAESYDDGMLRLRDIEVTLVGAGRAGSQIALVLAMLGVALRVYDGDRLGEENQGLQLYRARDVRASKRKVHALRALVRSVVPDCRMRAHPVFFEAGPRQARSPLVVLAVDTMATRRRLWERLESAPGLLFLLDVRLGRGLVRLHEVRPGDAGDVEAYEASLYDDESAAAGDCSDEAATHAAAGAAALVGGALRAFVAGLPRPRWIGLDLDRGLWAAGHADRSERSGGNSPPQLSPQPDP